MRSLSGPEMNETGLNFSTRDRLPCIHLERLAVLSSVTVLPRRLTSVWPFLLRWRRLINQTEAALAWRKVQSPDQPAGWRRWASPPMEAAAPLSTNCWSCSGATGATVPETHWVRGRNTPTPPPPPLTPHGNGVLAHLSPLSRVFVWVVRGEAPKRESVKSAIYSSNRIIPDGALGPRPATDEIRWGPVSEEGPRADSVVILSYQLLWLTPISAAPYTDSGFYFWLHIVSVLIFWLLHMS